MNIQELIKLRPQIWKAIENDGYFKTIAKDDFFAKAGTIANEIGFVLEGVFRVYYLSDNGEELNLKFTCKGEFLMADYIPNQKSIFFIQALTEVRLWCLPYIRFEQIEKKYEEISRQKTKVLSDKLKQAHLREVRLRNTDATERYLHFLENYPGLIDIVPHYHIANYLNITPTQLSRIRAKL